VLSLNPFHILHGLVARLTLYLISNVLLRIVVAFETVPALLVRR